MAVRLSSDNRPAFSSIGSGVTVMADIDASASLYVEGDIRCATLVPAGNGTGKGAIRA